MAVVNYDSGNQGGNFDVAVPNNAFNVRVYAAGGKGGGGGSDSGGSGGGGGNGRYGAFSLQNYVARTLQCRPGGAGPGGPGCFGRGTGRSSGSISGGGGGAASGCSGSGGGGGGGSGVFCSIYGWIICAGGGGGGGGGSWNRGGGGGGTAGGWGGGGGFGVSGGSNGGGATCGDGAGGGGGGGGAGGAGGGGGGCDNQNGGSGGGGAGSRYYSSGGVASLFSQGEHGGGGYVRVTYTSVTPEIFSFAATPQLQTSGNDGIPNYDTTLTWNAIDYTSLTLTSSAGESWNVTNTNGRVITNLPQSVAGSNSPSSRNYTLTACYQSVCTSSSLTVSAYNDNDPSVVNISSTVIPGGLNRLNGSLAPNTPYLIFCSLNGVDMPTKVRSLDSEVRIGLNQTNFGNSRTVPINGDFYIEFTSLDYNTSTTPGGTNAQGEVIGQTNSKSFQIEAGTDLITVTVVTKAPVIQEAFDFSSSVDTYPYPDIDVVPEEPNTDQFTLSNQIPLDDIEVDVEVKSSNPDVQVRINGGGWQNLREL